MKVVHDGSVVKGVNIVIILVVEVGLKLLGDDSDWLDEVVEEVSGYWLERWRMLVERLVSK